jgi:hypothetical protein
MKPIGILALVLLASLPIAAAASGAAPTVRSRTEVGNRELVVTLELVHADRPMYVSTFTARIDAYDALGLSAPAGWAQRPDASDPERLELAGRLDLKPNAPVVLRFPMTDPAAGSIKLGGMLEYGGGVEREGEMFLFDVVYPCAVAREGPAWGSAPPPECEARKRAN